ncbi:S8 family peptidase [Lentzea sp. NPDC042327]|uniref:S8 family peptidase n=1 Tax=Lentzea sp. NPDC042327 TaxID=3154801 RepID=UPI0033E1A0F9
MRNKIMRAVACAAAAAGVVAMTAGTAASQPEAGPAILNAGASDAVADRYIVVFKGEDNVDASAAAMVQRYGGTVRKTYDRVVDGYSATMSATQAAKLAKDPKVAYVQQVNRMSTMDTQTPTPNWGVDRIDQRDYPLDRSYSYPSSAGQGVRIYILDSGINASHSEFTGRIAAGYDYVDDDRTPQDCNGHGTHVAGTAAGTKYGVAKKATIVPMRVLNCKGDAYDDDILAAADWVAKNAVKPAVVNYSIGCRQRCNTPAIDNAVKAVVASGVQWVQAAGNSTDDSCYYSPQKVAAAVTVGNATWEDERRFDSNYGSCLDIWAPGTDIVSASYSSTTGTATMSGTSMASPHVAGAAALYLARNTSATPAQVRDALVRNATTNRLTGIGSSSPNALLYTAFLNGAA